MDGKTIEDILRETGETSPFKLARHLGVSLEFKDLFCDIVGMYIPTQYDMFFINSCEENEVQEKVCFQLLIRFIANNKLKSCITKQDIVNMERSHQILTRMKKFIKITKFSSLAVGNSK